jgi:hypothetical protein
MSSACLGVRKLAPNLTHISLVMKMLTSAALAFCLLIVIEMWVRFGACLRFRMGMVLRHKGGSKLPHSKGALAHNRSAWTAASFFYKRELQK